MGQWDDQFVVNRIGYALDAVIGQGEMPTLDPMLDFDVYEEIMGEVDDYPSDRLLAQTPDGVIWEIAVRPVGRR